MPILYSPYWDEDLDVCVKHMLPQLPCLQCAAEKNPHVTAQFTETDIVVSEDEGIPLSRILPAPFAYLAH